MENCTVLQKPPMPTPKNGYSKENIRPAGDGEAGLIGRMGAYEESRRKLREERNREYNQFLAKVANCVFVCFYRAACNADAV